MSTEKKRRWVKAADVRGMYGIGKSQLKKLVDSDQVRKSKIEEAQQGAALYAVEDIEEAINRGVKR